MNIYLTTLIATRYLREQQPGRIKEKDIEKGKPEVLEGVQSLIHLLTKGKKDASLWTGYYIIAFCRICCLL